MSVIGILLFFPVLYLFGNWFYNKLSRVKKASTVILIIIGMYILIFIMSALEKSIGS